MVCPYCEWCATQVVFEVPHCHYFRKELTSGDTIAPFTLLKGQTGYIVQSVYEESQPLHYNNFFPLRTQGLIPGLNNSRQAAASSVRHSTNCKDL